MGPGEQEQGGCLKRLAFLPDAFNALKVTRFGCGEKGWGEGYTITITQEPMWKEQWPPTQTGLGPLRSGACQWCDPGLTTRHDPSCT